MNNGELKNKVLDYMHRSDLTDKVQDFVNTASSRLNNRFGFNLGDMFDATDSNEIIANHDELYFYMAMREGCLWIKDIEQAVRWDELADKECDLMNIHNRQDSWTPTNATPCVLNEAEQAALEST